MYNQDLKFISFGSSLLTIGIYSFCSCAFNFFLTWYDTGVISTEGWLPSVIGGAVFGLSAIRIEHSLYYHRRELWPQKRSLFYLRLILLSAFYVDLGFGVGYGVYSVVKEVLAGAALLVALKDLLLVPVFAILYWLMALPFGLIAGLLVGLLLRVNLSTRTFHEDQARYTESLGSRIV